MAFSVWSLWCDAGNETAIVILVSVLAVLWSLWNVKNSRKANARLPPGPRGLPLVGYLPFLGTDLHRTFTDLAGVYGPIFKILLGKKLCVVVSSPSLVKEVRDQDTIFANRDPTIAALVASFNGNGVAFTPYGPEWRKLRKLFVGKMMSNASLDACYNPRKQEVKKTIRDVYNNKIGKPIDVGELTISTLMCVIQNMLWGNTFELGEKEKDANLGAELKLKLGKLMELMGGPNVSDFFPVLSRFDIQGIERKAKKISLWFENIICSAVQQYRNKVSVNGELGNKEGQKDFLQLLLELKENEDSASSISMLQFKALLGDIITGGTDTTTTIVEWATSELMRNPEVMKKVQEELAEVVGMDSLVEEFHLPKLKYLDAIVKETLRLHPALPFLIPRRPSQSSTIGGYTIPEGTTVMLNVWAIHRDPQLWDNPLEFRPERFLKDDGNLDYLGNSFQYMPFGSGRRICAGIALAERMLMFVLASFLHSFEWKLPRGTVIDFSEKFGIVMKKKQPLVAIPTPRLLKSELYH